jgi:polar amino acid transport system substrate-binding protein
MRRMLQVLLQALLGLLVAGSVFAADLAPTGTLRAVFLASNPVQARLDPQTGTYVGPAPDLIRVLAKRLGVPFTLIPAPDAASVIDSVKSRRADIGFLAYEAARASQVDFSEPYALMANAYAVRADSPIMRSADVDRPGVKVGAVKGQSQQIFVSAELKNAHIEVLPTMPANDALALMLLRGELDAFAANRQRMTELVTGRANLRVLNDNFLMIGQAIVVEKGDTARLAEVNRFITDMRASGFVKTSIERAKLTTAVEPAPAR